ncbi:uncharacterized protein K452DRAFT_298253 [Neofusicoccum parvum]|nr:uncharacterized protein K452DRAFT_298253 [Neofusicoccum parvum]
MPVSARCLDELLAAAQPLCFNEDGCFGHDLATGKQDAAATLLLLVWHDLTKLSIFAHYEEQYGCLFSLLVVATSHRPGASATTAKSLAALTHLQISHATSNADGLGILRHAFLLSSIHYITAHNVGHAPNVSRITHLSLLGTDVWSTNVLDLCRACTALTCPTLRWNSGDADLRLDTLCAALRLHGATLEHLVLDVRAGRPTWPTSPA